MWMTALILTSAWANDGPRVKFEGRVQLDYTRSLEHPDKDPAKGFQVRRGRAAAKVYATDEVWAKVDISLKKLKLTDLYVNVGPSALSVRAGRQKMPTSHAYLESSRFIPFAERPMLVGATAQDRTVGAMVHGTVGSFTYEVAAGETTPFDLDARGTEAYARATVRPAPCLKIAAWTSAGSWRGFQPDFETSSGFEWAQTAAPLDGVVTRQGVDAVLLAAPFRIDAEITAMQVSGTAPVSLTGGYLDMMWMLTGEEQKVGKRVKPAHPITSGGAGAFQVGARIEHVHVARSLQAQATALTAGLNWYPQAHVKVPVNVTRTQLGKVSETTVQVRFQIEG